MRVDDFDSMPDKELIALTREGEKDAYAVLWKRHLAAGIACASRVTHLDAEDVVTEAYTKILRTIQLGKGPTDSFRSYLYATIRNVAITQNQRWGDAVPGLEDAGWDATPVEGDVLSEIDSERISRVFFAMKPIRRQVLWLSAVEERSTDEIAAKVGITKTNVLTLAQRARQDFVRLWTQDHVSTEGVPPNSEHAFVLSHAGEYLAGKPSDRVRRRVETHLEKCEECSAKLEEAKSVSGLFRSRLAPAVTGAMTSVVMASDQSFAAQVAVSKLPAVLANRFPATWPGVSTCIAAVLALVMGVGGTFLATTPTRPDSEPEVVAPAGPAVPEAPGGTPIGGDVIAPPSTAPSPSPAADEPGPAQPAQAQPTTRPAAAQLARNRPSAAPALSAAPAAGKAATAPAAKPQPAASEPATRTQAAIVIGSVDAGPSGVCEPAVSGTARPGSTIRIGDGGVPLASVSADAQGRWASPRLAGFGAGRHTLTASSPGGDQAAASATVTIAAPPLVDTAVDEGLFVVSVGGAIPGVPVALFIDGRQVATLTPTGTGATYETARKAGAQHEVGVRYQPPACHGPTYTMTTGL